MRNLEVTRYVSLPPSPLLKEAVSCFSVDGEEGVWAATAAGLCRISPDLEVSPAHYSRLPPTAASNPQVSVEVPLVDGGHVTPDDDVIGVECVSESVCVATRNGDILIYNTQTTHVCMYSCSLQKHYELSVRSRVPGVWREGCSEWRGAQTRSWLCSVPERGCSC